MVDLFGMIFYDKVNQSLGLQIHITLKSVCDLIMQNQQFILRFVNYLLTSNVQ